MADAAAQKRNKERPRDHCSTLALARMEFRRVKQQADHIFSLQRNVLFAAKQSKPLTQQSQTGSHVTIWGTPFRVAEYTVHETEAMLCPRFLSVLANFMAGEWTPCNPPLSLLELYVAFVEATGWIVPINVSEWDQTSIPVQWRSGAASAWLHETSYGDLVLARQSWNKQLKTFQHTVKRLLHLMQVDASLIQHASLARFGKQGKVQSLTAVPSSSKSSSETLSRLLQRRSLADLLSSPSHPTRSPAPCNMVQVNPSILWNLYMRRR